MNSEYQTPPSRPASIENSVDPDQLASYDQDQHYFTGPRSAVGNVSGYRCVFDCRPRGCEFDPCPVPYFRGDWSWNNFYGHSPPFHGMNHSRRVVIIYERKYVHEVLVSGLFKLAQEKVWLDELTVL